MTDSRLLQIWTLLVIVALSIHLGGYALFDPDEGRNGEAGREMAATNDYVLPHFDGMPYLDKPVVYFAAEAVCMEVLGPTETAARLPALLFTLLTAAVIVWFARRVWGEEEAWTAAVAMLSMPFTLAFSRTVIFDSALMFFIVSAIVAFYFACHPERSEGAGGMGGVQREPIRAARPLGFLATLGMTELAWAAIAFGVLTKGPVAIAVPLLVMIPYAIVQKRFRALWSWGGLAVFIVIIAPWVWAVSRTIPDFLRYVLVTETAQRLTTPALKRTGPPWYFIPYLIGGALPWSIALLERRRDQLFLWLWLAVPFVFFSLSQSKRPQYILPLMPAVALLAATRRRGLRWAAVAILVAGVALVIGVNVAHVHLKPAAMVGPAKIAAMIIGICCVIGGTIAAVANRRAVAVCALSLPVMAIPVAANPLLVAVAEQRSTRSFIAQVAPYVTPQTEVVGIQAFTGSMPFYLHRPIVVVTPNAEELTSNYIVRHYGEFTRENVRPMSWLNAALADAKTPRVYIVRNNDAAHRALLESRGLRLVAVAPHHVAYTTAR